MPLETWGTFSVTDHQRPRAFVAEVLLYDRLVIPVPPDDDEEGWSERGWEPERMKTALSILGEKLVRRVPWGPEKRRVFRARLEQEQSAAAVRVLFADQVGFDAANITDALRAGPGVDPKHLTRLVLADHASERRDREFFEQHPDVYVEPVAAYPSADSFSEEIPLETVAPREAPGDLACVVGWEFFVPEDETKGDEDLLAEAVELAHRESFRQARTDFHEWRRELVRHGASEATALADMERRVDRYREETQRTKRRTRLMNAFAVAGIGSSLAAAFVFPPAGIAGGFIAAARFGAEKILPDKAPGRYAAPAAMFHDARKQFGWKEGVGR